MPSCELKQRTFLKEEFSLQTDSLLRVGTTVEILLTMPEEITGERTTDWLCTGHVVRVEPVNSLRSKPGFGGQFDCYQILRAKTP